MRSPTNIKLLLTDVDGVWTEGSIIYGSGDIEIKHFNVRDGLGIRLAQKAGIVVGVVSSRTSQAVARRCSELGIEHVIQGAADKSEAIATLLDRTGYTWEDVCYIGDDLPDLGAMKHAAISAAPSDAAAEVQAVATWRLNAAGGKGALRELIERLLIERHQWDAVVASFVK